MNYTEEQVASALKQLNTNIEPDLLAQISLLLSPGSRFVLLDLFNDSGFTVIAEVLAEDGLFKLDIDMMDKKHSFMEEIEVNRYQKRKDLIKLQLAQKLLKKFI